MSERAARAASCRGRRGARRAPRLVDDAAPALAAPPSGLRRSRAWARVAPLLCGLAPRGDVRVWGVAGLLLSAATSIRASRASSGSHPNQPLTKTFQPRVPQPHVAGCTSINPIQSPLRPLNTLAEHPPPQFISVLVALMLRVCVTPGTRL
jgi:hypothetical protein